MSHSRKLICSFLITLVLAIPVSLEGYKIYNSYNRYKPILSESVKNPQSKTVNIVARVGGYTISSLSGWASPFAEISLSSQGIARKTTADDAGFFVFNSVSLPDDPKELCLISQDVNQLPSFPLCLAPPPRNQNIEIKDVLLSPTLSLDNGKILRGRTTKASGMTVPNSKVEVYLFVEQGSSFWSKITKFFPTIKLPKTLIVKNSIPEEFPERGKLKVKSYPFGKLRILSLSKDSLKFKIIESLINSKLLTGNCNFELCTLNFALISSAYAANFPIYETKSNENGYFEFSLPASTPSNNRIFVSSIFNPLGDIKGWLEESNYSPKSNTLAFRVMGLWELFKRFLQAMFNQARFLLPNWNDQLFIIMIEILILFGLLAAVLAKKGEEKTKEVKGS